MANGSSSTLLVSTRNSSSARDCKVCVCASLVQSYSASASTSGASSDVDEQQGEQLYWSAAACLLELLALLPAALSPAVHLAAAFALAFAEPASTNKRFSASTASIHSL